MKEKLVYLVRKNPLTWFFALTFIISWSGILVVSLFTGMPANSKEFASIAPIAMLPLVIGPALVSIFLTILLHGKKRLKEILFTLVKWKVGIKFYVIALLTIPAIASIILFILSVYSTDYLPKIITSENKLSLVLTGSVTGTFLTLFEEIGWTGFATPELRKKYSVLSTGLILGSFWGLWHFLPVFYGCGDTSGKFNSKLFYPGFFFHYAGLIPVRIIMVWLYDNTKSMLLPWLMHATLTSCTFFILNISQTGFKLFIYYLSLAILLWSLVYIIFSGKNRYKISERTFAS